MRQASWCDPSRPSAVPSEGGRHIAGYVAAAAVRANPLAVRELHAHDLAAARTVLHRAEADLDIIADLEAVLRPAEPHQFRDRATLERPRRHVAVVVDDDMKPSMRVDEFELLHRARQVDNLRLIEHGEGMMREGGRRQQRCGHANEAESFPGHYPLHDVAATIADRCNCRHAGHAGRRVSITEPRSSPAWTADDRPEPTRSAVWLRCPPSSCAPRNSTASYIPSIARCSCRCDIDGCC